MNRLRGPIGGDEALRSHDPHVGVIVLNWEGWYDTARCVRSLERVTYPNYSIIIVDNGSRDGSEEELRCLFPDVTILQTGSNLGFSGGNNVGIRHALDQGADFVWLLNNDTVVDQEALSELVSVAKSSDRIAAVGSVVYSMAAPDQVITYGGGRVYPWLGSTRHHLRPPSEGSLSYLCGASLLLKKSAIDAVGSLDEGFFMYWEDADLSFRLVGSGWEITVAPASYVWHTESGSLGKRNPMLDFYFNASAVRFFKKHSSIPSIPISIGILGRVAKRVVRGDWQGAAAVVKGYLHSAARKVV